MICYEYKAFDDIFTRNIYDKNASFIPKFIFNQTQMVQQIPRPGLREQSNQHMRFLNEINK